MASKDSILNMDDDFLREVEKTVIIPKMCVHRRQHLRVSPGLLSDSTPPPRVISCSVFLCLFSLFPLLLCRMRETAKVTCRDAVQGV